MEELQSQINDVRLQENLSKKIFFEKSHKLFEPVTKSIEDANGKSLKESHSTSISIAELNETTVYVKAFEMTNKNSLMDV